MSRFYTYFIQYKEKLTCIQPRLSINAVTSQNFELPVKIAAFVNDIFASYSLVRPSILMSSNVK